MKKRQVEKADLYKRIQEAEEVWIYGAGVVAYGVYKALLMVFDIVPKAFIVTKTEDENILEGICIKPIETIECWDNKGIMLIATPEIYHAEIRTILEKKGISNCIYVDTHTEYLLMSEYYEKEGTFRLIPDENELLRENDEGMDVSIYMAKSHMDKKLQSVVEYGEFVRPIQVGATLTTEQIASTVDNIGDNISLKNRNYSELTATYWVWKNVRSEYKGICHYRRQLLVGKRQMNWVKLNQVDVILPLPFVCYPDTKGQYGRYINEEDQCILMRALNEISPEYAKAAEEILKKQYLYNYNMLIAREDIFDKYCAWMFPILFYAEELRAQVKPGAEDRFAGYFGEVLTAIYFLKNKDIFKIVHAEKKWYV